MDSADVLDNVRQIADFRPGSGISTVWAVALWRMAARISPAINKNVREQNFISFSLLR